MNKKVYQIVVGNIGTIDCENRKEAFRLFSNLQGILKNGYGRAAGEDVTLFCDGEILKEYTGKACEKLQEFIY